jgi:hypothetical protein
VRILNVKKEDEYMQKEIVYSYEFNKKYLFDKLNNRSGCYHNYDEYLIEIKNDNTFFLGIEKGGHTGYWYVAHISENDGKTIISGDIVFDPDENGKTKSTNKSGILTTVLLYVIFWPIMLLSFLVTFLLKVFKIASKTKSKEEKLDSFMINYLCCSKISN